MHYKVLYKPKKGNGQIYSAIPLQVGTAVSSAMRPNSHAFTHDLASARTVSCRLATLGCVPRKMTVWRCVKIYQAMSMIIEEAPFLAEMGTEWMACCHRCTVRVRSLDPFLKDIKIELPSMSSTLYDQAGCL